MKKVILGFTFLLLVVTMLAYINYDAPPGEEMAVLTSETTITGFDTFPASGAHEATLAVQTANNYMDSAQPNSAQTAKAQFEQTANTAPEPEVSFYVICPNNTAGHSLDNVPIAYTFIVENGARSNIVFTLWSPEVAYYVIGNNEAANHFTLANVTERIPSWAPTGAA